MKQYIHIQFVYCWDEQYGMKRSQDYDTGQVAYLRIFVEQTKEGEKKLSGLPNEVVPTLSNKQT